MSKKQRISKAKIPKAIQALKALNKKSKYKTKVDNESTEDDL